MPASFSTLTEWTRNLTYTLFEVPSTHSEWLDAFNSLVSPDAVFTINGVECTTAQIRERWHNDRELYAWYKVDWERIGELPRDLENPTRAGIVAGFYVATGVYKKPVDPALPAVIKKRTPHVYVEPRDPDSNEDTRQLVRMTGVSFEADVASLDE